MASRCLLFDLDGTLCDTSQVDDLCYREAVSSVLGVSAADVDWPRAPVQTDSGIARWLWQRFRGRDLTHEELIDLRGSFVRRLQNEHAVAPERFSAIEGASRFVEQCLSLSLGVGIATGCWRDSAVLKLEAAALPFDLLLATSDDAETRIEIFSLAKARVGGSQLATILFGDSICDVITARELGWEFVGVGRKETADRLREAGARCIIPDYKDSTIESILCDACVP